MEALGGRRRPEWHHLPLPGIVVDDAGRILTVSSAFLELLADRASRFRVGDDLSAVAADEGGDASVGTALLRELAPWLLGRAEHLASPVQAGVRWFQPHGQLVDGHRALCLVEVTEQVAREDGLRHRALHDPLTGLPNRALLAQRLEAARDGLCALMFFDLDHFKQVNDQYGHQVGDLLLRHVARRLREEAREHDTVARLGGDEFVVLAPGLSTELDAVGYADRLLLALATPVQVDGRALTAQASVGVAVTQLHADTPDALLRQADEAMLAAKRRGRGGRALFGDRLRRVGRVRAEQIDALRLGISQRAFVPHFQPVVELRSRRVVGAEALVRWQSPDGLVPPGPWLEIADRTLLLRRIDAQVQQQACATAAGWPGSLRLAVNISARQVQTGAAERHLLAALGDSGLPPERVVVEVTESAVMDGPRGLRNLRRLRESGLHLSLDDFGTGYASLGLLQDVDFDEVKIDRSFTGRLATDPRARAIVRSLVDLTRSLSIPRVVAEGVETEAQRDVLLDLGCRYAQGYLFGAPAPALALPVTPAPAQGRAGAGPATSAGDEQRVRRVRSHDR